MEKIDKFYQDKNITRVAIEYQIEKQLSKLSKKKLLYIATTFLEKTVLKPGFFGGCMWIIIFFLLVNFLILIFVLYLCLFYTYVYFILIFFFVSELSYFDICFIIIIFFTKINEVKKK